MPFLRPTYGTYGNRTLTMGERTAALNPLHDCRTEMCWEMWAELTIQKPGTCRTGFLWSPYHFSGPQNGHVTAKNCMCPPPESTLYQPRLCTCDTQETSSGVHGLSYRKRSPLEDFPITYKSMALSKGRCPLSNSFIVGA